MQEVRLRKNSSGSATLEPSGPVAEQKQFEAREENRIVVPEILEDPHPLVARSVKALRKAKRDHQGYLQPKSACLGVRVTVDSVDRAMCIYDALLKALDTRGYAPSIGEGGETATIVRVGEEDVSVLIEEQVERVEQEDTTLRRRRHWSRYGSEADWKSTGRLVLRMDHSYLDGVRRSWGDGKKQRVEDCLNAFVIGLVSVSEALKARRLEREAWQRERREAEARRAEEARLREEEAARVRALESALTAWQRCRLVREYVAGVRQAAEANGTVEEGSPLASWLAWAEDYANRVDPLLPEPSVPMDPGRPDRYGYR